MADNFEFRDANGLVWTLRATDQGGGLYVPHHILEAGELHIGQVGGRVGIATGLFTRPANTAPYAVGDAVNNSVTVPVLTTIADFVRVNSGNGYLIGLRLVTNLKSITPRFRVHLYTVNTGTTLSNDNAAFQIQYIQADDYIAYVDLPAMTTPSDTTNSTSSQAQAMDIRIPIDLNSSADDNIYYTLETLDIFTPASGQNFKLYAYGDMN